MSIFGPVLELERQWAIECCGSIPGGYNKIPNSHVQHVRVISKVHIAAG